MIHEASRLGRRQLQTSARRVRGYAASRVAYDARRRRPTDPVTAREIARYKALLAGDPCSYCMGFCGQMAADHIDALAHGGEHDATNLTAAGRPCNAAKKDQRLLLYLLEAR